MFYVLCICKFSITALAISQTAQCTLQKKFQKIDIHFKSKIALKIFQNEKRLIKKLITFHLAIYFSSPNEDLMG